MNVDSIVGFSDPAFLTTDSNRATNKAPFINSLMSEFSSVNNKLVASENAVKALAMGQETNVHQVMLTLEEARLSFQLLAQVRNKVLESYQEILRMQI